MNDAGLAESNRVLRMQIEAQNERVTADSQRIAVLEKAGHLVLDVMDTYHPIENLPNFSAAFSAKIVHAREAIRAALNPEEPT